MGQGCQQWRGAAPCGGIISAVPRPASDLVILLPPSEGKAPGGGRPPWRSGSGLFGRRLAGHRTAVAEALAAAGGGDAKLLGVSGAHLDRARAANTSCLGAPTLPAWRRFTGVVWEHLDPAGLDAAAAARAASSVVVVSALCGLSGFADPVPDHRLKMSARLDGLGGLAGHWRDPLSSALNDFCAGRLVIDLLPSEHAAAWTPEPNRFDIAAVDLVDDAGRRAGHAAKAAKGALTRALVGAPSASAVTRLLDGGWSSGGFTAVLR